MMACLDRIVVNPEICLGQPVIRSTRVTVGVVLRMVAAGHSLQDVVEAYPELEEEDVRQALQYAAWVVSEQIHVIPAA